MQIQKTIKFKVGKLSNSKQEKLDLVLQKSLSCIKGYRHKENCNCKFCSGKTTFKKGESNRVGMKHLEKSKELMRNKKLGVKRPDLGTLLKGRTSPRKGVKLNENTINKIKTARENQSPPNTDRKFFDKWIKNLSKSHKGIVSGMKGKNQSDSAKIKIRKARAKQILPIKDTSIEVKIQNFLKELGIEFYTHYWMNKIEHKYQCDIFIPSKKLIIECFGNYWHKYPIGRDIDNTRCIELRKIGFKVLVLWESEIKVMELNDLNNALDITCSESKALKIRSVQKPIKLGNVSPPMTEVIGIKNIGVL